MLLRLGGTHHEGRVGHIGVYLLDHEVFRSLTLILVSTFSCHLILPLLLSFQVILVSFSDVFHNQVDRHLHAVLSCARTS